MYVAGQLSPDFPEECDARHTRRRRPAHACKRRLELLGSRRVNFALDHDAILIGARAGGFTALKLEVVGGSLEMYNIKVTFGNAQSFSPERACSFMKAPGAARSIFRGRAHCPPRRFLVPEPAAARRRYRAAVRPKVTAAQYAVLTYAILSRMAYVLFVGYVLRREEREGFYVQRFGPVLGFRRFRQRASIVMYNDASLSF